MRSVPCIPILAINNDYLMLVLQLYYNSTCSCSVQYPQVHSGNIFWNFVDDLFIFSLEDFWFSSKTKHINYSTANAQIQKNPFNSKSRKTVSSKSSLFSASWQIRWKCADKGRARKDQSSKNKQTSLAQTNIKLRVSYVKTCLHVNLD